jgi:predicted nucleic-acid-binding protein
VVQDDDVVETALELYRANKKVDFADCLILAVARKACHTPLGTFDRTLAKLEGVTLIA